MNPTLEKDPEFIDWVNEKSNTNDDDDYDDENDNINDDIKDKNKIADRYYNWEIYYPFLTILFENHDIIVQEMNNLIERWTPWPEKNLYEAKDQAGDWTVVPFLHTFPATDPTKSQWITLNCDACPKTTTILKQIPGLRTALLSRLGPMTRISSHQGWADLANHVLRCHFPLIMPKLKYTCGMWVEGEVKYHNSGEIIVFDDSKLHKAFNASNEERIILIIDIIRPTTIPLGLAVGGHTDDLDKFINQYNKSIGLTPTMSESATSSLKLDEKKKDNSSQKNQKMDKSSKSNDEKDKKSNQKKR